MEKTEAFQSLLLLTLLAVAVPLVVRQISRVVRLPIVVVRAFWNKDQKIWRWTVTLPAWILLIFFVISNAIPSLETIQSDQELSGVNYLAHLSGILAALTVFFFVRKDLLMRYMHGRAL